MSAFDPRNIERDPVIEVVDEGTYIVSIHKCTSKEDDFGHKVKVFYQIVLPEQHKGKLLMDNFNLGHANPEAARIGKAQFAKLLDCIGMGKEELQNFSDIEGKQLKIEVDIVPHYKDVTQTQNKIKKHMPNSPLEQTQKKHKSEDDLPF